MAKIAIYARVSTSGQTVENQIRELTLWAERVGHEIVEIYQDAGISGTKGRDQRPGLDKVLKDAARRKFDLLAVWSVDRLGRSLQDVVSAMQELRGAGVGLFLHQQALDTTTPAGKAMFGMLAVFGEFEAAIIKERVNAGLARAKANGVKLGRPKISGDVEASVRDLRQAGVGIKAIAKQLGLGTGTVQRIVAEMQQAAASEAAQLAA
jgi:DNA invertase Pin-like site-specific DNA recombinase